jgi:hypothetical protein
VGTSISVGQVQGDGPGQGRRCDENLSEEFMVELWMIHQHMGMGQYL